MLFQGIPGIPSTRGKFQVALYVEPGPMKLGPGNVVPNHILPNRSSLLGVASHVHKMVAMNHLKWSILHKYYPVD